MMQKQIVLKTENLSIGYSKNKVDRIVADNINLKLESGKLISLIGVNGAGKSTLLRTITGIQKAKSGQVFICGKPLKDLKSSELAANLSIVLTEKLPPSNLTVFELIALGRQPYTNWLGTLAANDYEKVNQAMILTQTHHLSTKKHHEISDGQLQKVLIARALSQDTPVIILDEPTTHLDLVHKAGMFKLLRQLTRETGKCILFSTHDIDMAIQLSDEILIMNEGHVKQATPSHFIADGSFNNLFTDPNIAFDEAMGKYVFINL